MQLPLFFRRLSFKIGFSTAVIAWVSIEIVVRLTLYQSLDNTKEAVQNDLIRLANVSASVLSGDDHRQACAPHSGLPSSQPSVQQSNEAFERIRRQMAKLRTASGFREHWYTFIPTASDSARFGVMTHEKPFAGDVHIFRDSAVAHIFHSVILYKRPIATGLYNDDNGSWISGFAPIIDSTGIVTGVLELDLTYNDYAAREKAIYEQIALIRWVGLIIAGMLGMLMGWIVAGPVQIVSRAVNKIADHDFLGSVTLPVSLRYFPDETAALIINVNKMAAKLNETMHNLREANERMQSLDHAKSIFLSFVAHELRTPLTGLYALRMLEHNPAIIMPEEEQEIVSTALVNVERLRGFSIAAEQYIAALTHTRSMSEEWDVAEIVAMIVDDVAAETAVAFETSGHETAVAIEYTPPTLDNGDFAVQMPYKVLFTILSELLENAVKFGAQGNRIIVKLWRDADYAYCSIQDFGEGIAPELASRVFEPFFVETIEHHKQGVGVNLATARVYARHYNGDVVLYTGGKGHGCTFTASFELLHSQQRKTPLAQELPAQESPAQERSSQTIFQEAATPLLAISVVGNGNSDDHHSEGTSHNAQNLAGH